ncbi:MAG: hypothetical protein PHI35_08740, partial [Victivallaceae bacterium]|nr:hypothetical protein [Victivallaceae bacterium]
YGDSTDGYGLEMALRHDLGVEIAGKTLLFIGAGGAARATGYHLAAKGAGRLLITNRTPERAEALAYGIAAAAPGCVTEAAPLGDRDTLKRWICDADVLIQATSAGLRADDTPPFELELLKLHPSLKIFDAIYRPTPLLCYARNLGMSCTDGESMLIYQGARSFELWTGLKAPIEAMRDGFNAKG